jgi:dihydroceramidase
MIDIVLVAYGLYGLLTSPKFPTGPRLASYCGLMGVGFCSAGYHMTLKYHTQMCMLRSLVFGIKVLTITS